MDGEEHRLPTPHRSGRARAPQALASALARAEVDGAVLVWCSPLPGSAPFCGRRHCVGGGAAGTCPLDARRAVRSFWGRLGSRSRSGEALWAPANAPLPLDPPWPASGIDQQVLQKLAAAQE